MEKNSLSRKRRTKYNIKWEECYSWITADKKNESYVNCKICNVRFSIAFGGNSNIVQHMQTEKHQSNFVRSSSTLLDETKIENNPTLKNYETLCRICLQINLNEALISVFDCDCNNIKIAKKIYDISGIFIDNTDSYSNWICVNCNDTLSIAYDFRIVCQESDLHLKTQKDNIHIEEEIKFEISSNVESEFLIGDDYFEKEKKECTSDREHDINNTCFGVGDNSNDKINKDLENKKNSKLSKPNTVTKRYCRFRTAWLEKYDFIKQGRDKGYVFCTVCHCEFSIAYGGENVIVRHMTRDKHYYNLNPSKKGEKMVSGTRVKCAQSVEELCCIICEVCGNKFPSKRHLRRHLKYHSDIKEHECEICKKQFRELMHLKRHMRVHTGEKPYSCKYCGKKYSDYSSKIKHERVHTNERPYVCQTCGKAFMISDTLKRHIMTHTGEKPFCCGVCNAKFSRKTHLQAHMQSITHRNRAEKFTMESNKIRNTSQNFNN